MTSPPIQTDALIIGAGPVGLFQVFQLGILGIKAHIVDSLPMIGGQCQMLYPEKFIYDIPAMPAITGAELVKQLSTQIAPFKTPIHLGEWVQSIEERPGTAHFGALQGPRYLVSTQNNLCFDTASIFIAAGVGAFVHKEIALDALKTFRAPFSKSPQVIHDLISNDSLGPSVWAGKDIVIYGSEQSAVTQALQLARHKNAPRSTTLVFRRDKLNLEPGLEGEFQQALDQGNLHFRAAQVSGIKQRESRLTHLELMDASSEKSFIPCDYLVESLGLSPKLGPLLEWQLEMQRKALKVSTETFETSKNAIYAVGDINTYPGKRKLILSGFHEATLAAYALASKLSGGKQITLEYTSASSRIHQILGV